MQSKYTSLLFLLLSISFMQTSNTNEKWDGKYYKKNSSVQQESALMLLEKIPFKGNESILDVGCGDGKITYQISQKVPNGKVVGFDISKNMIETAQQTYTNVPNLSFHIADAANFTLDQTFDYVVSFYVLHWIEDMVTALTNIKNVLKPGGKLFLKVATAHKTCPIENFFNNLDPKGKWVAAKKGKAQTCHRPKTEEEFAIMLDKAGFKEKNVKIVYESFYFESFDKLVKWFM